MNYCYKEIEKKWQKYWDQNKTYQFIDDLDKPKFYILDMFPYPSGSGLHVGHIKGYLATDIYARYKKMKGFCVLHPMGWDAFGLPAEQYAIKHGKDPKDFTLQNINNFRTQLKDLSFSYDFDLEINTSDPNYYAQTQWIFLQLYKHKLAELRWTNVNWCPELKTVLANEEIVIEGNQKLSERGNFPVQTKKLQQWLLKITNYADRLLSDLDEIDWSPNIKKIQQTWIDKKEKYKFSITHKKKEYFIFLNEAIDINRLVGIYIHSFSTIEHEIDLNTLASDKTPAGFEVEISFNHKKVPVFFLKDVDFRAEDLIPKLDENLEIEIKDFEKKNKDSYQKVSTYKLKDWVFSRQRKWGEPFPVYYRHSDNSQEIFLDEKLPVTLPSWTKEEDFLSWLNIDKDHVRDTNTMPNWAGSSWYFLAYIIRQNNPSQPYLKLDSQEAKEKIKRWMSVDIYVGGQEHANLHLLYARFWYKFLYDLGIVHNTEPFNRLVNQGMILAEDGSKMSKSKNNSVNTKEVFDQCGADVLRLNMAFIGPTELSQKWDATQIQPLKKWLERIYKFFVNIPSLTKVDKDKDVQEITNNLVKNSEIAINKFRFNVVVSEMMIFFNKINDLQKYNIESLKSFLKIMSLIAPSFAEELWFHSLNEKKSIYFSSWPKIEDNQNTGPISVQINNSFKKRITINYLSSEDEVIAFISSDETIKKALSNKNIVKTYMVPKKMINFITEN